MIPRYVIKPPLWLRELASPVDRAKEIEPHELMRLGEEVQHAIAMPDPKEMKMEKHDMSKMKDSNTMVMPKSKTKPKVKAKPKPKAKSKSKVKPKLVRHAKA